MTTYNTSGISYHVPMGQTYNIDLTPTTEAYTANLVFQGTNVVSGNTTIDGGNIELKGGVTFAGTVQAGSAEVKTSSQITFNDHVDLTLGTTEAITFHNGGNVVLNNGLAGNVDFNGQNATVTLSNGNINGDIDTSVAGSGTLKFTTADDLLKSVESYVYGNIGETANLKEIIMDGTGYVDVNGTVASNLVTFNSAGTLQVNSLNTTRQDSTLGTVNFKEFNGTLKVDGGNLKGNVVTDLGNNGIVTMMNGSQSITGQIGTSTNKIQTLNIGDTGEDSYSVTTMNGDIYAEKIVFNNRNTTNGSELSIAADYDVTAAITTADDGMGTLKLLGGTQTVTGQVGTNGMRLAEVDSGADGAISTFKNSLYATTVQNIGTGSSTFESDVHATNVIVNNSNEDSETTTGSTVTFEDTVTSAFITITGNGEDSVPSVSFEKLVTVSDNVVITDAEVTVGKAAVGEVSAVPANMSVGNDVTVSDSIVNMTGNLSLTGGASTLTIQDSSEFNITGNVALIDITGSTSSIEIKDSAATFNGTVTVADNNGNLNITDTTVASLVKFNGIVDIGNNISIDNNIAAEDAYSLVLTPSEAEFEINVYTPNPLATKVEFNANVTGNDLSVDNSIVSFGNLASEEIDENAIVANIENNLNLINSYVTLNGDLNVTQNMTVENSYGKFTASGINASVTVGNTLTIDDTNTLNDVSFITVDSKLNVGQNFVVLGNDNNNNNNSFVREGEETTIVLNDNVTVGIDFSISSAFVNLLGSGNGEDALYVANNVDVNNSLLAMKGGDITVGRDMTVNNNSQLIVGIVDYYTYMTDLNSNGGTPVGDYSAASTTNMDIRGNLTIDDSIAMLGNKAGMYGTTFGENIVNVTVANDVNIVHGESVTMVGDLELTGNTSTLTISDSSFNITGSTLLSSSGLNKYTDINIDDSTVTFDGTVEVISSLGNLNVTDTTGASIVTFEDSVTVGDAIAVIGYGVNKDTTLTFNGNVTATDITFEDATVDMGAEDAPITVLAEDELNIFDSTLTAYADITVENNMDISGSVVTITGNTDVTNVLTISDSATASDVDFNGEVVSGSIAVNGVNGNKTTNVTFNDIVLTTGNVSIEDATVTFNDTLNVGNFLNIIDSAVTFEEAVTIDSTSNIYSYAGSTTNVHFKDTVIANADIFVDSESFYNYDTYTYSYGNTTVTFEQDLTIRDEGIRGILHLDGDYVTVNANGHINANVEFDDNAKLNVADTKNIYGTVTTTSNGDGILNFLGSTTLNSDIGEDSLMLSQVNFGTSGENTVFTQDIGYDVYAYQTTIGNGDNLVTANIKDNVRFGEDLRVRSGSTLNVADNDVTVDNRLILDSDSTTNFKVYTTDISAGQAVENEKSGRIDTDYLSVADDAKFNITYDGSWYGAGQYTLVSAINNDGEDSYLGTEANGLVTDNSIIDSVVKTVDGDLVLFADRTGGGSYDAEDLGIVKSEIGNHFSNGASRSIFGIANGTQREGALADIINEMEDLDGGVVITDEKKQQLVEMQQLLAPVANNSAIQSSLTASNLALGTIGGRISEVRGAGGNILALNDSAKTGLSAGESTLDTALWIKAVGSTATQDKVGQFDGYDADTYGIVAGADKTLKNGTILGLALAYSDTETEQSDFRAGDSSDTNSIQATAYASKDFGNLYVDGMLSYAKHSTDAIRTANSGKLSSDIDANQYSAKIETGYKFVLAGTTTLTPFASIEYGTLDQKSYTEKGTSYQNDALKVDGVKVDVGTFGLGAKLATNVKAGNMTLIPELTLAAYNSFGDDSADIKAQYVGGGNKFITPTQELNETMFNIGAGVKTALSESSTLILDLDHDRSENGNFEGYSGSVSYRLSF